MPKNSLIDSDFEDEFNPLGGDKETLQDLKDSSFTERVDFPEPADPLAGPKVDKSKDQIEIEIVTDTPEKDRGKWVADDEKDGKPDIPDEDEIKNYSADVQKRISKMTARIHAERRAREEQERVTNEAITAAKKLLQEKNSLLEVIESGEKTLIGEHKGRLESQLATAKNAYREAYEASDVNGQLAAQESIAKIVAQMERLSSYRPQPLARDDEKEFEKKFPTTPAKPQLSERGRSWQEKNTWFATPGNEAMSNYALGLHQQVISEGVPPDSEEYYRRIDAEMHKRFPEKFKVGNERAMPPRRQGTPVAPATRTAAATPRTVQITESQAKLARRLGLTVEQYAQQLLAEQEKSDGKDYTHF